MKTNVAYKVALGICLIAGPVLADTIIVPGNFTNTEAASSDNAPLGVSQQHFQQVFGVSLLTNFNAGDLITGIAFRVNGGEAAVPAQTITAYDISLSRSAVAPGSLSATFAANRGADFTTVRSGPLTLAPGQFPGGATPNNFGWINFSTPYQYIGGPLLIEVAFQGFTTGRNADAAYPFAAGVAQSAFGTGYASTTADLGIYNEALVIGFARSPVVIPEPSPSLLFGMGFLLLAFRPRRGK